MTKITAEDIEKVAKLARLQLPKEQIEKYTNQLEKILEYVDHLQAIDTTEVPPTTRALEVINYTRKDEIADPKVREQLLELAPQREDDFYRVPKILSD